MTAEEKVKAKYPDANLYSCWPPFWYVVATRIGGTYGIFGVSRLILGAANGPNEAWESAYKRIEVNHDSNSR